MYDWIKWERIKAADPSFCCFSKLWLHPSLHRSLTYPWDRSWRPAFTNETLGSSTVPANAWGKRHAWTNCPIEVAFLFKDVRSILTSSSLKTWLVRRNQKRWRLVSTNEKWQMHKSFRLWRVMGSAWHSPGLFADATAQNYEGFLMQWSMC